MTAVARTPEVARPAARTVWDVAGVCLAAAAFAVLCVLVLRAAPYLPEPDDYAYRASIVAMTDGHFFTLSGAQAHALAVQLAPQLGGNQLVPGPGGGPVQWVQLPGGRWISEKDPGYPYLAAAFQALGLIRLAPLLRAGRLPGSAVAWWLGSVCAFGVGVATFNTLIYGGPLRSGYRPGEITFSLSALGPNLRYMPAHLIQAMPMLVLGLAGLAGRQPLVAITTLAVVAALFGLGSWAFHDMYQHPFGPQIAVVPGPGGTVESSGLLCGSAGCRSGSYRAGSSCWRAISVNAVRASVSE
jgi:hypothetical protein